MTQLQARDVAREILRIVPLVMRTVATELRAGGEFPAPAHFGLLTMLSVQPRSLSELAGIQGVSLPTMSNSVRAMAERGWVKRTSPARDRRVAIIEVTATGRAVVDRVGRAAEAHLAQRLIPLDAASRRSLQAGLGALRDVFSRDPRPAKASRPQPARTRTPG
jgi:DNA-binding MarR family transcriptional regulator